MPSINQIFLDPSMPWNVSGQIIFDSNASLQLPQGTSFPTSPTSGDYFFRTDENTAYRYNGSIWVAAASVPTAHKTTHEPGGSDALTVDAAASTGSLRTIGTGALQSCAGNDSRLSDARTPTAHASSHQSGGSDSIKLDDFATPDDNTDLNATTGRHGLLLKLGGGTTNFLRADGSWAAPSASGSVFGQDYTSAVVEGTSTTTSATYQDKVTLTTGAWTGTYLIQWQCEIMTGSSNTRHQCRLYDVTNATELDMDDQRPSAVSMYTTVSGFALVTLAGVATTYKIQFASQGGSATITIRRARAVIWRVS